jgi:hypothetical protein
VGSGVAGARGAQGAGLRSAGYSHAAEPAGKGEREERRVETVRHPSNMAGRPHGRNP